MEYKIKDSSYKYVMVNGILYEVVDGIVKIRKGINVDKTLFEEIEQDNDEHEEKSKEVVNPDTNPDKSDK